MKRQFIQTENAQRFQAGIAMLGQRGALEAGWMLVVGRPGEGKTTALHNFAAKTKAVMLTAQEGWTQTKMMRELAEKLGIVPAFGFERRVEEIIAEQEIPVVMDEAGFALKNHASCLERLRGITDRAGTVAILAAMERDELRFSQYDQISSRITLCRFHKSSLADVRIACTQLAEVEIDDDLVERIHCETSARMRLVVTAINRIEMAARRMNLSHVCAKNIKDLPLCEDFSRARRRTAA